MVIISSNRTVKKPGRPRTVIRKPQWVECVVCFKTFDLNLRSLDQVIISDDKFCISCFNEIMNPKEGEYHQKEKQVGCGIRRKTGKIEKTGDYNIYRISNQSPQRKKNVAICDHDKRRIAIFVSCTYSSDPSLGEKLGNFPIGFSDICHYNYIQCENLICTHPGENATCVSEGAVATTTTPPTKLTCEECLKKFLNAEQLFLVTQGNLEQFCATSPRGESELQQILTDVAERTGQPIDQAGLIQCLKNAGIVFIGGGG